jgi:thiol-disulfide isomerase/thioredoxin
VEGNSVSLDGYKDKVVIVDFWGTWCPPCRTEIPHFVKLQEKYRDRGLQIVGLNYERGDPDQAVPTIRQFMTSNKMNYPRAGGDRSTQQQVPDLTGFPTTLFIDRSGKVRMKLVGLQSLETLEAIVQTLLDESNGLRQVARLLGRSTTDRIPWAGSGRSS